MGVIFPGEILTGCGDLEGISSWGMISFGGRASV